MDIVEKIYRYCAKEKISRAEFAKKAGITEMTLYNLEHKRGKPTKSTLAKIEVVLEGLR